MIWFCRPSLRIRISGPVLIDMLSNLTPLSMSSPLRLLLFMFTEFLRMMIWNCRPSLRIRSHDGSLLIDITVNLTLYRCSVILCASFGGFCRSYVSR